MSEPLEWRWSDAWILHALLMSGPRPTLPALIAVADYANHAIPELTEVQGAFD